MSEVEHLRALRGVPKGLVTKMVTWVAERGPTASIFEIDVKIEQLKKYEAQFDHVQGDLEKTDPAETEPTATERSDFEDKVAILKAKLFQLKAQHPDSSVLNETVNGSVNVDVVSNELPKFQIPTFSGDYKEYPQFMDSFNALVHNSRARGMTDIRRFAVLKSSLAGKALKAIEDLPMTAANYTEALRILKERFEHKRLIFESYLNDLWEQPKAHDTCSLRALCDSVVAVLRGLDLIATPVELTTGILNHLILSKCDRETVRKWEEASAAKVELCNPTEFLDFLRKRCTQLESVEYALKSNQGPSNERPKITKKVNPQSSHVNSVTNEQFSCPLCKSGHAFTECKVLRGNAPRDRYNLVKNNLRCVRCINEVRGHLCRALCEICRKPHHTLLHFEQKPSGTSTPNEHTPEHDKPSSSGSRPSKTVIVNTLSSQLTSETVKSDTDGSKYTFLATALAYFRCVDGNYVPLRILFDGGSQSHLISDRAVKLLGLSEEKLQNPLQLRGINSTISLNRAVVATVKSMHHEFDEKLTLVVHRRLQQTHPTRFLDISSWNIPSSLSLADRKFNVPQEIDVILNANQTYQYLLPEKHVLGPGRPILQNTLLGWIVVGDNVTNKNNLTSCTNTLTSLISDPLSQNDNLAAIMQKFWEVESFKEVTVISEKEAECERHFKETCERSSDGKFVLRLPFARSPSLLGSSYAMALRRLKTIKKKIDSDSEYGKQYNEFMEEYIAMGHCSVVESAPRNVPHCYIPHFAVHNPDSTTTKTRVVFDASAKTSSGFSLNDVLMVGPTIQKDLVAHLINFRSFAVGITGDLSKMYRNIEIAEEDRKFQMILWFEGERIVSYRLNTVTYGTASAPFAAIRCLKELADVDGHDVPLGAETLRNNFYVDDWLGGADTPESATEIHEQLQKLLTRGKLTLRKIQSNSRTVMQSIPEELKGTFVTIGDNEVIKTLGMYWIPESDVFVFTYRPSEHPGDTKRTVLSEIGRLFDPLGLVQPVIIKAKIFMQQLWSLQLSWDDTLPSEMLETWLRLRNEMKEVEQIQFSRFVRQSECVNLQIHGFSDASEKAYGACVYIRTINRKGIVNVQLLIAKTRVAPLKTVSLPRLEMLGTLLLAELFDVVKKQLPHTSDANFLWSDSTIALKWINSSPHKWEPYIGTRVTKIQSLTSQSEWRHVPSAQNPADIASRGLWPSELVKTGLWFNGPSYLLENEEKWPPMPELPNEVPETKRQLFSLYISTQSDLVANCKYTNIMPPLKFMVWPKIKRVFAYVSRFIARIKSKWRTCHKIDVISRQAQPLSVQEVADGVTLIAKIVQCKYYYNEIKALLAGKQVPSQSKLITLGPMLDPNGVIRVGGRVKNAPRLAYDEKYPIVLPYEHPMSEIIGSWSHNHNLHAPQSALLAFVRQQFWIIKGKTLSNKIVRSCLRCSRLKPVPLSQIMASLPPERVSEVKRPFLVTSVDFAGPFVVHHKGRGSRTTKVYVAVYVCFSSKATHLDVVENLSTDAFLDSLLRFVGRRGVPAKLYSDNGTNFVGTRNKLNELAELLKRDEERVRDWCRDNYGIEWTFMPPRTPHFGGLHESAVKSMKQHFTKIVANTKVTLWNMLTVVGMIEGVMNSRPLVPLALCPQDNQPLTPGHLLIGEPLNALPEPKIEDFGEDFVYQWSSAVAIRQLFWRRWSKEYLQSLQCRYRWSSVKENVNVDDLVLLIDKNAPSVTWAVGRVVEVFKGNDDKVRVVNVKTSSGTYKRGISELCPFPSEKQHIDAGASMGPGMSKNLE